MFESFFHQTFSKCFWTIVFGLAYAHRTGPALMLVAPTARPAGCCCCCSSAQQSPSWNGTPGGQLASLQPLPLLLQLLAWAIPRETLLYACLPTFNPTPWRGRLMSRQASSWLSSALSGCLCSPSCPSSAPSPLQTAGPWYLASAPPILVWSGHIHFKKLGNF